MSEQCYDVCEYRTQGNFIRYKQSEQRYYERDDALRHAMERARSIMEFYNYDENEDGYLIIVQHNIECVFGTTTTNGVEWFWCAEQG